MDVRPISVEEFDRRFDDGEDMADYIDWNSRQGIDEVPADVAASTSLEPLDLPEDLLRRVALAAERANVSREVLAAKLIAEGLDRAA